MALIRNKRPIRFAKPRYVTVPYPDDLLPPNGWRAATAEEEEEWRKSSTRVSKRS